MGIAGDGMYKEGDCERYIQETEVHTSTISPFSECFKGLMIAQRRRHSDALKPLKVKESIGCRILVQRGNETSIRLVA